MLENLTDDASAELFGTKIFRLFPFILLNLSPHKVELCIIASAASHIQRNFSNSEEDTVLTYF